MSNLASGGTNPREINAAVGPHFQIDAQDVPHYITDLANSRLHGTNRHSRASSLVSVSTKFTTNTLNEDARSIDLVLGGQYFRIARDGSRVTDAAPPPYSGVLRTGAVQHAASSFRATSPSLSESSQFTGSGRSICSAYIIASDDEEEEYDPIADDGAATPRQQSPVRFSETSRWGNILDVSQLVLSSPVGIASDSRPATALTITDELPDRYPSYKSGVEVLNVVLGDRRSSHDAARLQSQTTPLRRYNGVRLPSLDTYVRNPSLEQINMKDNGKSQSAGPVLTGFSEQQELQSPDFIGRTAIGHFPQLPQRDKNSGAVSSDRPDDPRRLERQISSPFSFLPHDDSEESDENMVPLPMDSENDISLHYAGMMRRLDREHRRILQAKDHEMVSLKQQLNEKDIVYRQELRSREFVIDDLRKQLEHMQQKLTDIEQSVETRIEKAIFRTEDIWESRWKDRDFHLRERMRRIEEDAQRSINAILDERSHETHN